MSWSPVTPPGCRYTSGFGPRATGIPGASTFHRGMDLAPPVPGQRGVPVYAAGPGLVSVVSSNAARGLHVRIRHDDGSSTLYQHLDVHRARVGQRVDGGTLIGVMGATGIGAGVHLHFETYPPGANAYVLANAVDPLPFMRARGVDVARSVQLVSDSRPTTPGGALPDVDVSPIAPITPLLEDDMILISAPGRGSALVGPGYHRPLNTDEEIESARALAAKTLAGSDRQFDVWRSLAVDGRLNVPRAVDIAKAVWNYVMHGGGEPLARESAGERLRQIRRALAGQR